MIVVRIIMQVIPEKQKELVQTILSMIEPMEKEKGCISYSLFCNMEDKCLLNLLQEWHTRRDLDQYLGSDMFGVFLGTKSLLIEPHGINIYTIHQSEGMEAVYEARGKQRGHSHAVAPNLLKKD
ncbi:antibiotic biosynthesis monooxygenase family protein [uncultured Desulfosarcina sp.]|uniref:putative quinol monooxygenase n=1 Tax=uncultured Desulfosarcina sp. TaxID=218289 RepID=UPI0029C888BE|nr:antibiotic biosynthesis monooxygenase family protein [uncultured Desulfosarcina sp.]